MVNGVLRRFLREQEDILAVVDKHWQTLHPEWFVNKLKKSYPNCHERRRFKFIATSARRQETYVCARLPQWSSRLVPGW